MADLHYNPFVVNETAYCFWDWDVSRPNLEFLDTIDPTYFEYVGKVHLGLLEGKEKQYAATTLRVAYSHALETLFALLCATAQAPDCVIGWMTKYQNRDLYEVVRKIHKHEPVLTKLQNSKITWQSLSETINLFTTGDDERDKQIGEKFANFWRRLADEYLENEFGQEYNSIKHGLRVNLGGFHLAFGVEDEAGTPATPDKMRSLGGSTFGSSFYFADNLVNRTNFRVVHQSINWNPLKFAYALDLIAISIKNIIASLRIMNGVSPDQVTFYYPTDEQSFNLVWEQTVIMQRFSFGSNITPDMIGPLSPQQIMTLYKHRSNDD